MKFNVESKNLDPIPAKDTVDKYKKEQEKPAIPVVNNVKPPRRKNVPWLELQFLKFKYWVRNDVSGYVDKKVDKAMEIGIKSLIARFWWVALLIVFGLIALMRR